jgi:hypothetical protein
MKLGLAIGQVASAERELAGELLAVGERHRSDHDVFHLTKTLAGMELGHLAALAPHARRYGIEVDRDGDDPCPSGPGTTEPALQLLHDLRELHLLAAGVSLDWVALGQGA